MLSPAATDFTTSASLVKRHLHGVSLQRNPPQTRHWSPGWCSTETFFLRSDSATPITKAASLAKGDIKNGTLQPVRYTTEAVSNAVVSLVECDRNSEPLQQIPPLSRRW
jgi:hypothetical protein